MSWVKKKNLLPLRLYTLKDNRAIISLPSGMLYTIHTT